MPATYQNNFKKFTNSFFAIKDIFADVDLLSFPHEKPLPHHQICESTLFPWSTSYASTLIHINLFQVVSPIQLEIYPHVLVRDGLFTLIDFFNRFPSPKEFTPFFLIHKKFQAFIPKEWLVKVLFFDFEIFSNNQKLKNRKKTLLIKGSWMDGIVDFDQLKKILLEITRSKQFEKYLICLPPRLNRFTSSVWTGDEDYNFIANHFMKFMYQEIGTNIDFEFINWEELFAIQDIQEYSFLDCNSKSTLYIDDYTNYYLLNKGARPLSEPSSQNNKKNNNDYIVPLSFHHGIRVFEKTSTVKINYFDEIKKTLKLLNIKTGDQLNVAGFRSLDKFKNEFIKKELYYI